MESSIIYPLETRLFSSCNLLSSSGLGVRGYIVCRSENAVTSVPAFVVSIKGGSGCSPGSQEPTTQKPTHPSQILRLSYSMSGPVLLSLTSWAEEHISAILTASTQAEFDAAFDAAFIEGVHVTFNGEHLSREHYKKITEKVVLKETSRQGPVFANSVEVPTDSKDPIQAGNVGLFYTAQFEDKTEKKTTISVTTISLNIGIIQDLTLSPPKAPGVGLFDPRRISTLNEVAIDTTSTLVPVEPGA
ncbi:hypothetical protein AcV7_010044 [Taiwanofungus camphoratus]|nr:hypothetical protein AcV7_010044 [Antrodia cinnamomea]